MAKPHGGFWWLFVGWWWWMLIGWWWTPLFSGPTRAAKAAGRRHSGNAAMRRQARYTAAAVGHNAPPTPLATAPPPNFYADPNGQPVQRWWDGQRWTEFTR